MCTMIVEKAQITGSGKGVQGWFPLREANVFYDHPDHLAHDHGVNIDFVNESEGLGARVAVELTPDSARDLVRAINAALARGQGG